MPLDADPEVEGARRDHVIDSAIELIAEQGHARASLSRIAARAEISKAAVLYYFTSKDELLEAVLARVNGGLRDGLEHAVDGVADPVDAVFAHVRTMAAYLAANPTHARVISESAAIAELAGRRAADPRHWERLADLLVAAQKEGQLRTFDARTVAVLIDGAVNGLIAHSLANPDFELAAAVPELEAFVRRAATPD